MCTRSLRWVPEYGFGGFVGWTVPLSATIPLYVLAAGSTSTLLISILAVLGLTLLHPRGLLRTALIVLSFYFIDSILHIIPVLGVNYYWAPMNVRSLSETFFALADLGVPGSAYIFFLAITSTTIVLLLIRKLSRPA